MASILAQIDHNAGITFSRKSSTSATHAQIIPEVDNNQQDLNRNSQTLVIQAVVSIVISRNDLEIFNRSCSSQVQSSGRSLFWRSLISPHSTYISVHRTRRECHLMAPFSGFVHSFSECIMEIPRALQSSN